MITQPIVNRLLVIHRRIAKTFPKNGLINFNLANEKTIIVYSQVCPSFTAKNKVRTITPKKEHKD